MTRPERRTAIVRAARREFIDAGYTGARMKAIAERAGITEAVIYQHFGTKAALFEAAVVAPLEEAVQRAKGSSRRTSGADEHFMDFFRGLLDAMSESAALLGVVLFSGNGEGAAFYRRTIAPLIDRAIAMVERNLQVWPHREFEPRAAMTASFGMRWFLITDANFRGRSLDHEATARQLTTMVLRGVGLPEPGDSPSPTPR